MSFSDRIACVFLALGIGACATGAVEETRAPVVVDGLRVAVNGEVLGGIVEVDRFWIPAGTTVWVERDLQLIASGVVRIDGELVAHDGVDLGCADAPNIRIASIVAVDVPGRVRGGHGRDGGDVARKGGNGSTVRVEAPMVYVDGELRGGDGGKGGVGSDGGTGGSGLVEGFMLVRESLAGHFSLRGGSGGNGGFPGGDGGDSGGAQATVSDEVRAEQESRREEIELALTSFPQAPCRVVGSR